MGAAEKYREVQSAGQERPLCGCHGEPLVWCERQGQKAGGSWRCAAKRRAADARYYESEKGRATRARYSACYYRSPGYEAAQRRYYSNASGAYVRWRKLGHAALRANIKARLAHLDAQLRAVYAEAGVPCPPEFAH